MRMFMKTYISLIEMNVYVYTYDIHLYMKISNKGNSNQNIKKQMFYTKLYQM